MDGAWDGERQERGDTERDESVSWLFTLAPLRFRNPTQATAGLTGSQARHALTAVHAAVPVRCGCGLCAVRCGVWASPPRQKKPAGERRLRECPVRTSLAVGLSKKATFVPAAHRGRRCTFAADPTEQGMLERKTLKNGRWAIAPAPSLGCAADRRSSALLGERHLPGLSAAKGSGVRVCAAILTRL